MTEIYWFAHEVVNPLKLNLNTKNVSDEYFDTIETSEDFVTNKFHKIFLYRIYFPDQCI